jgi:peptidoglycan-associated lipoprotein
MRRLSIGVLALAAFAACSHAQPTPDPAPEAKKEEPKPAVAAAPEKTDEQKAAEYKAEGQAQLNQAMERLHDVSVFFEFDEHTLTAEARARLGDVAAVLAKHHDLHVKIEGHADERGTADYNLALGQRRAESTKAYLLQLGVGQDQIDRTVSYGSERPKDPGHSEEAWKQNRRGDVSSSEGK